MAWFSPVLSRTMELLWFGERGRPVLVFPTSKGRYYQNEDFGLVGALADKVDAGFLQLVCVDSIDAWSWYDGSIPVALRARRHDAYDRYLRHEVAPLVNERTGGNLVTLGASFGAYHAANFAARYPGLVTKAICFSGLYRLDRFLQGGWDELCYYHSPAAYIANMDEGACSALRQVEWVVATGEHDALAGENRDFADLLRRKGQRVTSEIWPGVNGHDWPFWNEHVRNFI